MTRGVERDPLCLVELSAIIEEVTSDVRHGVRNKLGAIRNASFYVRRRLSKTEVWAADPRLEAMASLLDSDVATASELVGYADERLHKCEPAQIDARSCVLEAVERARVGRLTQIKVELDSATTRVDPAELAVAVRCIIENAAEAMNDAGLVQVRGQTDGERYVIEVIDQGPGITDTVRQVALNAFYTTKPGHAGLGLNVAQRIAQRYGSQLVFGPSSSTGASVSMAVEIAKERPCADDLVG